jgi:phosphotransferase system enzyme I (PtsI)
MGEVYIMSETTASGSSTATFSGQTASPGTAYGPLFLSIESVDSIPVRRLADSEVEAELDRVDSVARAARVGLVRQRDALGDRFTEEQTRIFDTHLRMLEDPVIEADIRGRIREDHLSLEGAVRDALSVYERLFEVVETEALRNKLADMRDVALRLLRHCNRGTASRRLTARVASCSCASCLFLT